jgi:DNA-binding winged helix-turn-helix (wHTH) protein
VVFVSATHKLLRFDVFELNLNTEELRKCGTLIKLAPQPFRLLALLANRAGQVVTREEIKGQLWGKEAGEEVYVDFEQGMYHCIKQIRTVLGDNADNSLYIETLARRGYRFLAPVVSKNVLAPAPKVTKSQSGIQSGVLPALTMDRARTVQTELEAAANAKVMVTENEPETKVVPIYSTTVIARAEVSAPVDKVTSADALAPEIARLRNSRARVRRILVWAAFVLALLAAGVVYWQLHRP